MPTKFITNASVEGWLKTYVLGLCKILLQNIVLLSQKDKIQLSFAKLQHDPKKSLLKSCLKKSIYYIIDM
jgi:hypothetical protein